MAPTLPPSSARSVSTARQKRLSKPNQSRPRGGFRVLSDYRDIVKRRRSWSAKNHRRRALRAGLTVEQYVARLDQKQRRAAEREEASYVLAEARAKHADMAEERIAERRATASARALASYHADPRNWSTARRRRRLFERDGWRCRVCHRSVSDHVRHGHPSRAVAGHILARATGGAWTDENMATLCHPCNVKDGVNRVPIQMGIF